MLFGHIAAAPGLRCGRDRSRTTTGLWGKPLV